MNAQEKFSEEYFRLLPDKGQWLIDRIDEVLASGDPNPYQTLVLEIARKSGVVVPKGRVLSGYSWIMNRAIPKDASTLLMSFAARRRLINLFSFAVPTKEAIDTIVKYSPILEVGAGSGYWASLIDNAGADVVAIDKNLGRDPETNIGEWSKMWIDVRPGGPEDISKYPDRTLFLCWPSMSPMAAECLKNYKGKNLIYVGEGYGGCTADDEFFQLVDRDFQEVHGVQLPQWEGLHDDLRVFERKC